MSANDSFSPLISLKLKYNSKGKEGTEVTPVLPKRDVAPKLSLKKQNKPLLKYEVMTPICNSLIGTPTCEKPKQVSASFLFSSCKKKLTEDHFLEARPPILVADSSDEEYYDINESIISENEIPNSESELVHESLEEYSLIRKWLQNSDSLNSSVNSDVDSPIFRKNVPLKKTEIDANREEVKNPVSLSSVPKQEEIIILSSDEEENFGSYLKNILKKRQEEKINVGVQSTHQSDTDSPIFYKETSRKKAECDIKTPTNVPLISKREEILSSDEDEFENYLKNVREKLQEKNVAEKEPLTSSFINNESLSDDSFDNSFVFDSLQNKLRISLGQNHDPDLLIKTKGEKPTNISSKTEKENVFRPPRNLLLKSKPKVQHHHIVEEVSAGVDSDLEDIFADLNIEDVQVKPKSKSKKSSQTVTESFLSSLSVDLSDNCRHPDAVPYVKSFRKLRTELTLQLFQLFNEAVFQNQLPQDFSLTWNKRLTRTAGFCRHFTKRENGTITFESCIELSVKVVDTPCRLRDTLVHEMCHAATWMIDNCRAAGHGPVWKKYARLVHRVFPELPLVTRCHNYEITYKFYYNCSRCSFSTGRHSKSIDTTTHVCPYCRSTLQLSTEAKAKDNEPKASTATPKTPRTPNAFALFVKAHFATTKSSRPDLPHGAIMKILSSKFAESKKQAIQEIH